MSKKGMDNYMSKGFNSPPYDPIPDYYRQEESDKVQGEYETQKPDYICDCHCPCAYPVDRQGVICDDCEIGDHCDWKTGERMSVLAREAANPTCLECGKPVSESDDPYCSECYLKLDQQGFFEP